MGRGRSAAGCLGCLGVIVVPVALLVPVLQLLERLGPSGGLLSATHLGALSVRDGKHSGPESVSTFQDYTGDLLAYFTYALQSLLGRYYLCHSSLKPFDYSSFRFTSDAEGRFCHDMLSYMWVNPKVQGLLYPSVMAEDRDIANWIRLCRAEYAALGSEEKALLAPFREAGKVPLEVLIPEPDNYEEIKRTSREGPKPVLQEKNRKLSREEIVELLRASIAASNYAGKVSGPDEGLVDLLSSLNLMAPEVIPGNWAAVGDSIKAGKITKFDASQLLPRELFNLSFAEMARWEGISASRIAIFKDQCKPAPLDKFAAAREAFVQRKAEAKGPWHLGIEELTFAGGRKYNIDNATRQEAEAPIDPELGPAGAPCQTGYVHTRRLPSLHEKLPDIEGPMGIKEDVLRGQSMLWLGATSGGFHYDEEANVYLQLSGETFAFLVPQNYTDVMTGSNRHPWGSMGLPGLDALEADPYLKEIPIYLVRLLPGDGLTLQGRTYHRFMAQTQDRISLNWFFIPKWRRMEYTPADWYSKEAARSLPRLAVRQLWARTLARMWDEARRGVILMGGKLEYL